MSTHLTDYIIDCFYLRDFIRTDASLSSLFADPTIVKILHGCDSDIKYLMADLGILTSPVFDTARVFAYLQRIPPLDKILQDSTKIQTAKHVNFISLERLVKLVLNYDLDKFFQLADWRLRPLPKGMLDYARSDSHFLIPLYVWLCSLLGAGKETLIPKQVRDFSSQ